MQRHAIRDRLVYPVAAILAVGLVGVPQHAASAPRLAEVSAVRLQADVTSLVTGIAGDTGAATLPGAAARLTETSAAAAATCTYPCTVFDKFLENLPESIRYAILPGVYVVAWVVGAVMGLAYLVASPILKLLDIDPFRPAEAAAASAPAPTQTPATSGDPIEDTGKASAAPGVAAPTDQDLAPTGSPGAARPNTDPGSATPARATPTRAHTSTATSTADVVPVATPESVGTAHPIEDPAVAAAITAGEGAGTADAADTADTPTRQPTRAKMRAARGGPRDGSAAGPASPAAAKRSAR